MSEIAIVIGFSVLACAFVWWSVQKTTTEKTNAKADRAFGNIVIPNLLLHYGVDKMINGTPVKVLPPHLQKIVDDFMNRD